LRKRRRAKKVVKVKERKKMSDHFAISGYFYHQQLQGEEEALSIVNLFFLRYHCLSDNKIIIELLIIKLILKKELHPPV